MKHAFRYLLTTVLLLIPVLAFAQDPAIYDGYKIQNGVATGKSVSDPDANGIYTVTLESFATGMETIINKAIPSDIVLVLDYSTSMLMPGNVDSPASTQQLNNCTDYLYSLKIAVGDFVKMMQDNDETLGLQEGQTGNRIAFVIFAGQVYGSGKNDQSGSGNYYARHLSEFIPVANMSVVEKTETHPVLNRTYASGGVMYDNIDILSPSSYRSAGNAGYSGISNRYNLGDVNKGTWTSGAMDEAKRLVNLNLTNFQPTERSTTVVLFTDGSPSDPERLSGYDVNVANGALQSGADIKRRDVNIFTVGLLTDPTSTMKTFLEYLSSDFAGESTPQYPTSMPSAANELDPEEDYGDFSTIVSEGADLSGVFETIAEASGGSTAEIPTATQVVDVVSNSFRVPENFDASQVVVYIESANSDGTGWGNRVYPTIQVVNVGNNPPMTVQQPDDGKIGLALVDGTLTVLGFDFSAADSDDAYDGNWVGWRTGNSNCAGKKLVIQFDVEAHPDATGGQGTNTNMSGSGVYVPVRDENGNIIRYDNVNPFEVPHVYLPINLVIKKTGLRHGESATVQIYKSPQKVVDGKVIYDPVTGKPMPVGAHHDPDDSGWENFSKVILTNMGEDGAEVVKTLIALDASFVYMMVEDSWGWSYELDKRIYDTSEYEKNPFEFTNRERTDAPKHGEAVSVNHFRNGGYSETAKSSKTKTFTSGSR